MATTTANLSLKLTGANLVKGFDLKSSWTPNEQIEKVLNITDVTSPIALPFSDIDNIKEVFIEILLLNFKTLAFRLGIQN